MIPSWSNSLKLICHLSFVSDKLVFHTLVFVIQDLHLCTSGPGRLTPKSCNWYSLLIDTPPLVVGYAGSLGSSLKYLGWNKLCLRSTEGRGRERKEGGRKKGGGVWGEKGGNCFLLKPIRDNLAPGSLELLISLLCLHYFCFCFKLRLSD